MQRVTLACVLAGVTFSAGVLRSQDPPAPPVFRSGADLELLDVLVLDAHRRPVRGLTAADFAVLDNGRPRHVVMASQVDLDADAVPAAPSTRAMPGDVATNVTEARRLVVLVFDDATMPADPGTLRQAREVGRSVIDRLGPQDQAAVVFTVGSRRGQEPTGDRERLRASVDALRGGSAGVQAYEADVGVDTDGHLLDGSLRTLSNVMDALRNLRDVRKVVIYVGLGLPVDFESASTPALAGALGLSGVEAQSGLVAGVRDFLQRAAAANVSVYAVDPAGLSARVDQRSRAAIDFLQTVSAETGGRAIINTNEPVSHIGGVFEENATYYVLGIQALVSEPAGATHQIEVRVDRPGADVRARRVSVAAGKSPPRAAATLDRAIAGVFPERGIALRVDPLPYPSPAGDAAVVIVTTAVSPPGLDRRARRFDVLTAIFDANRRLVREVRQTADADVRSSETATDINFLSRFDLKPGRYHLRTAVRDASTGDVGSVYAEVDVPDFRREPVSLSGLVLTTSNATPRDAAIAEIVPVVPSTARRFRRYDRAVLSARVGQAAGGRPRPVTATVELRSLAGPRIDGQAQTIGAERFQDTQTVGIGYTLPLDLLAPGDYALTVRVERDGYTASRSLRFAVGP